VVGLALTLLLARQLRALIPAMWTLCVTMGLLALFGLPISVGTSMISCIAIGAGVDFAIHLGFRARTFTGPDSGQRAVEEIGVVTLISALQLACAFAVLLASELAPLREFGIGLAIGLVGAALGACWLGLWLYRGRSAYESSASAGTCNELQRAECCAGACTRVAGGDPWLVRRGSRWPSSQCDADHQMVWATDSGLNSGFYERALRRRGTLRGAE